MKDLIRRFRKGAFSRRFVKQLTSWVAILVVFTTTYMLILPAVAIDSGTAAVVPGMDLDGVPSEPVCTFACTYKVHEHDEDCYEERDIFDEDGNPTGAKEKVLVCGRSDQVVHEHDESCWQDGVLVCQLEENKAHEHDEDCYTTEQKLVCTLPEHTHTDACYEEVTVGTEKQLICGYNEGEVISPAVWSEEVYSEEVYDDNGELVQPAELLQPAE